MNENLTSPTHWQRTSTRRFLLWLLRWQTLRRALISLASLLTLVALFYAEENWRGQWAWDKFKREAEAKGERFDKASLIPQPVPDDQNLAMTPLLRPLFDYETTTHGCRWRDPKGMERLWNQDFVSTYLKLPRGDRLEQPFLGNWRLAKLTDLKPWPEYFRHSTNFPGIPQTQNPAADVLAALGKYDPELNELRAACQRPHAQFPLHWDEDLHLLLPHLALLKTIGRTLELHTIAALAAGQPNLALSDLTLTFRLANALTNEPLMMSYGFRRDLGSYVVQPVWEGLAARQWTVDHLLALQHELETLEFTSHYYRAIRGERALFNSWLEKRHQTRSALADYPYDDRADPPAKTAAMIRLLMCSGYMPQGWWRHNQLLVNQGFQAWLASDAQSREEEWTRLRAHPTPLNFIAILYEQISLAKFYDIQRFQKEMRNAQAAVNLALAGCVLERYRLAHGTYPDSLDALSPSFITRVPPDAFNGQPLKYRRTDDDLFILYSVGPNLTDDGGVPPQLKPSGQLDQQKSDWVWRYPANPTL